MLVKFFKTGLFKIVLINLLLALIAFIITLPTTNKAKELAQKMGVKYYDQESLREEIKLLSREDMCLSKVYEPLRKKRDFFSCRSSGGDLGLYRRSAINIQSKDTNKGRFFCFTVYKKGQCERLGGVFYQHYNPCYCLVPHDF